MVNSIHASAQHKNTCSSAGQSVEKEELTSADYLGTWLTKLFHGERLTFFFCLFLCRTQSSHHPGFQPRRPRQWQHGVRRKEGVCDCSVDGNKHHLSSPCAATWSVQGRCTGWKQWLPPDKVQWLWKTFPHWVIWKYSAGNDPSVNIPTRRMLKVSEAVTIVLKVKPASHELMLLIV